MPIAISKDPKLYFLVLLSSRHVTPRHVEKEGCARRGYTRAISLPFFPTNEKPEALVAPVTAGSPGRNKGKSGGLPGTVK